MEHNPRIHHSRPPRTDSKNMKDRQCEPEQFDGRIIFMSMFNDIVWGEKGNAEKCDNNSRAVANYAPHFLAANGHSWELD